MKETPIIMSGNHPKLILDGRKTQTRRVIKPQPLITGRFADYKDITTLVENLFDHCPYGQVGDRLWVRETWAVDKKWDTFKPRDIPEGESVYYPYGGDPEDDLPTPYWVGKTRPSIFMCRWMSRVEPVITDIRVERVQEIDVVDAIAEGVKLLLNRDNYITEFQKLWDSLNAKRGYGWEVNPWCWCISFRRLDGKA